MKFKIAAMPIYVKKKHFNDIFSSSIWADLADILPEHMGHLPI